MTDVKSILTADETIQWSSRQNHAMLLAGTAIGAAITLLLAHFMGSMDEMPCTINGRASVCHPAKYVKWVYALGLGGSVLGYFSNKAVVYYVTSKRILIESGLIGKDFRSIYFEQVQSCNLDVGIVDKAFGTGSIMIDTGQVKIDKKGQSRRVYDSLNFISNPYETYRLVEGALRSYKETLYK